MPYKIDEEKTKKTIAFVLEKMRTDADSGLLDEYYDIFKKEVSLFNRNKAAAYLLMLCDQGKNIRYMQKNLYTGVKPHKHGYEKNYYSGEGKDRSDGRRHDGQRYPLADEESVKLFFSAGRSRRVFPREILGIINLKTAIPKEDIGAIRILDNYSFVQVRDTVAEKIIVALNGMIFRGRPLTVNYARSGDQDSSEQNDINQNDINQNDLDDCQDNSQDENI